MLSNISLMWCLREIV